MRFKIQNVIAVGCLLISTGSINADDEPIIPDTKPPIVPKVPSNNLFTLLNDGDELIFESTSHELAEIRIVDSISGNDVFITNACLCPEYRCNIAGFSGAYSLVVTLSGNTTTILLNL